MWETARIDFFVSAPVCVTYPWIFFDSLVAHLRYRQIDPDLYRKQDSKIVNKSMTKQLGNDIIYHQHGGVSHASASVIDNTLVTNSTIYTRFEDYTLFKMRSKNNIKFNKGWNIRSGVGKYRGHMIKLITIPCKVVTFFAKCNIPILDYTLQGLPGIGKKTSIGYGSIMRYEISRIPNDTSVINENNIAMRPIPTRLLSEYDDEVIMNYKIPYWGSTPERCAPPGAKIKRKRGYRL